VVSYVLEPSIMISFARERNQDLFTGLSVRCRVWNR